MNNLDSSSVDTSVSEELLKFFNLVSEIKFDTFKPNPKKNKRIKYSDLANIVEKKEETTTIEKTIYYENE